jgi:hypothetical protein
MHINKTLDINKNTQKKNKFRFTKKFVISIITVIILCIILYVYYVKKYKYQNNNLTSILNNNIIHKSNSNSIIPMNVFQAWHSKNLPTKMNETIKSLRTQNQDFKFYLYDNNNCRNFIISNFSNEVLNAYDRLIPHAYKSDLWRYCILYKNGGIYLDVKYNCVDGFKLNELIHSEHFASDRPEHFMNRNGIYQAIIVTKPGNNVLLECINKIVENVNNKYYGYNPLYPTGPGLMGDVFDNLNADKSLIDLKFVGNGIQYNNRLILLEYPEYRQDQQILKIRESIISYNDLWYSRQIYN